MKNKWLIVLLAGLLVGLAPGAKGNELYSNKSLYRNIIVYEENDQRCMKFGRYVMARQSCIQLSNHDALVFNYTKMMMGALYFNPSPQHVLIIGLGGGTLPGALRKLFPNSQIDVAEIDPVTPYFTSQLVTLKPATHENSPRFAVTRTHSAEMACAAISMSFGPIGVPALSSPKRSCA